MGRKREWSKKSAKPPLLRRSKLSKAVKAEEWTARESTHSKTTASRDAPTSLREASKASREASKASREASTASREASTTSTASSSQEDFSGPAFRDLSVGAYFEFFISR